MVPAGYGVKENITWLACIGCGARYDTSRMEYRCGKCGDILEVKHDFQDNKWTDSTRSGVWRYKPLIYPGLDDRFMVTMGEGGTHHNRSVKVSSWAGVQNTLLKQEGENPTGSFKDRGMTVAVSEASRLGAGATICASTGNTSASAAAYSAMGGLESFVLIPKGNVSRSKMAQAVAYGARMVDVEGDFDSAMEALKSTVEGSSHYYVLNSINPWRLEGQKSIAFEIIERNPETDFIALPAGNLGNTAAVGKALMELKELGIIDRVPRIVAVQAEGANPFYSLWTGKTQKLVPVKADTIASAIRIGNPVNWKKALISMKFTNGTVTQVSDGEIMEAKKVIDSAGIGCEPASAASVAGVRRLVEEGVIDRTDTVVSVLTGSILKDIDSITGSTATLQFGDLLSSPKKSVTA